MLGCSSREQTSRLRLRSGSSVEVRAVGERARLLEDLPVGPRPRVGEVGQLAAGVGRRRRSSSTGSGAPGCSETVTPVGLLDDDEHAPRAQPVAVAFAGREHPREVGRVEVDRHEVVGLEVGGAGGGIGAQHDAAVDAGDVTRSVQRHRRRRRARRRRRVARRTSAAPAARASGPSGVVDAVGEPAPRPRQEAVRPARVTVATTTRSRGPRATSMAARRPAGAASTADAGLDLAQRHGRRQVAGVDDDDRRLAHVDDAVGCVRPRGGRAGAAASAAAWPLATCQPRCPSGNVIGIRRRWLDARRAAPG